MRGERNAFAFEVRAALGILSPLTSHLSPLKLPNDYFLSIHDIETLCWICYHSSLQVIHLLVLQVLVENRLDTCQRIVHHNHCLGTLGFALHLEVGAETLHVARSGAWVVQRVAGSEEQDVLVSFVQCGYVKHGNEVGKAFRNGLSARLQRHGVKLDGIHASRHIDKLGFTSRDSIGSSKVEIQGFIIHVRIAQLC